MQKNCLNNVVRTLGILTLLLGFLAGGGALAADCKGLSKAPCEVSDSCSWVGGYTSKSGKNVSSYCRAKPKSSTAVTKSSNKASSSGNAAKKQEKTAKPKSTAKDGKGEKKSAKKQEKGAKKKASDKDGKGEKQSGK